MDEDKFAFLRMVTPGYFDTMAIPLLQGRDFGVALRGVGECPNRRRVRPERRDEAAGLHAEKGASCGGVVVGPAGRVEARRPGGGRRDRG